MPAPVPARRLARRAAAHRPGKGPGDQTGTDPELPQPAATAAERLRQIRDLAREFRASVDLENGGTELRRLSQPLFRYQSKSDGAVFAFVLATDPEALLLIDERSGEGGPAWHYAFARMSNHSLAAKRRDRVRRGRKRPSTQNVIQTRGNHTACSWRRRAAHRTKR